MALPAMDEVGFTRDGFVGRLTLNRPDKLNAQTPAMWLHMADLGDHLLGDDGDGLRVVVVEGVGRSFSAGIDITAFTGGGGSGGRAEAAADAPVDGVDSIMQLQRGFSWLEDAPFLTIAKVQGHALGAGMQLALACDMRVAADDCQMGLLEARWGLMPDLGGTVWLPRLIGPARALEMIVTAARLGATELLDLGIVNRVVPRDQLDTAVDELVAQVATQPPLAVRGAKAAVRDGWGRPTIDGMRAAAVAQLPCITSADFREAATAFLEQRPPVYTGR
jgi:enoyl-CoA hydratase/carnithine racemase